MALAANLTDQPRMQNVIVLKYALKYRYTHYLALFV